MRFLVIGASGAQGGAVARQLAAQGHEVRGFSRNGKVPDGVRPFLGDLGDAQRVKEAFDGVTHASVVLPMVYDAPTVSAYVRHVIDGARAAGVRRLAFNTGNRLPAVATGVAAFETRRRAAAALLDSGVPTVVLRAEPRPGGHRRGIVTRGRRAWRCPGCRTPIWAPRRRRRSSGTGWRAPRWIWAARTR